MKLSVYMEEYLEETDNIYDLIGNCFGLLCEKIDNPTSFIGRYISDEGEGEVNPNLAALQDFSENILYLVMDYHASGYQELLQYIKKGISELEFVPFGDSQKNELTVIFYVLSGIDAGAQNWNVSRLSSGLGPLNHGTKTRYKVYFRSHDLILSDYEECIGRERMHESDFHAQFETFRFLNTDLWKDNRKVPRIVYIPSKFAERQKNCKKFKVAVIPGSQSRNFNFKSTVGSGIKVDYFEIKQEEMGDKICNALYKAVKEGCDVIVLPEYITSPEIYARIQREIKSIYHDVPMEKRPYLIFAGTTWTEDNNNVMRVLDIWGDEIGQYYKYSSFTKKNKKRPGYTIYEDLHNPGKMCDLFMVNEIGLILPAICRDVIDGGVTEMLTKIFWPFFLIISAFSPSVMVFRDRQKELAKRYFTSSILVNACSAMDKKRKNIGFAGVVCKENTVPGILFCGMERKECFDSCKEQTCVFVLEYCFGESDGSVTGLHVCRL